MRLAFCEMLLLNFLSRHFVILCRKPFWVQFLQSLICSSSFRGDEEERWNVLTLQVHFADNIFAFLTFLCENSTCTGTYCSTCVFVNIYTYCSRAVLKLRVRPKTESEGSQNHFLQYSTLKSCLSPYYILFVQSVQEERA